MIKALLDLNVASVLRRIKQGDCPTEPALSVETLENMVHDLFRALAATPTPPTLSEDLRGLEPFVAHWQPWMDERDENGAYYWPDDYEMSCFARVTYGDLRRARAALAQVKAS